MRKTKVHFWLGFDRYVAGRLKDSRQWISWLRQVFQKQLDEGRELAVKGSTANQPAENERHDPKYRMRIRIQTPSHSIQTTRSKNGTSL